MVQYRATDGLVNDYHIVHLGKFALGGAGLVFCEETAVEASGRKTYGCAGMYEDRHVAAARRVTDFIHQAGAAAGIQLGHAGRKASCGPPWTGFRPLTDEDARHGMPPWRGVSASPLPAKPGALVPTEMDQDDITRMIQTWRIAARRSIDAGFDVCEVHGAPGQGMFGTIIVRGTVAQSTRPAPIDSPIFLGLLIGAILIAAAAASAFRRSRGSSS